jgi:hypothetical protein
LPGAWRSLELGVQFRGAAIRVSMRRDLLSVVTDRALALEVRGRRVECEAGTTEIPYAVGGTP